MISKIQKVSFIDSTLYKISQKPDIKQIIGQLKRYMVQIGVQLESILNS